MLDSTSLRGCCCCCYCNGCCCSICIPSMPLRPLSLVYHTEYWWFVQCTWPSWDLGGNEHHQHFITKHWFCQFLTSSHRQNVPNTHRPWLLITILNVRFQNVSSPRIRTLCSHVMPSRSQKQTNTQIPNAFEALKLTGPKLIGHELGTDTGLRKHCQTWNVYVWNGL